MVCVALLTAMAAYGPSDAELAKQARVAFGEGMRLREDPVGAREQFRKAVEMYETLYRRGNLNPDLARNQGNAALLADDLAPAVLAYRRGLRLEPANNALQHGLALARERMSQRIEGNLGLPPIDQRPPWLPRVGFAAWSFALVLIGYSLGWLALARWRMTRERAWVGAGVVFLSLSLAVFLLVGLATLYEQRTQNETLVVIASETPLRLGDGENYPLRYATSLPAGVEAKLLYRRGDWLQIELSGGQSGWVRRGAVLLDE